MLKSNPRSMVMTRIGGVDYPMRSNPQCKTCQSPHRLRIENLFVQGVSYRLIAEEISGLEEGRLGHPSEEKLRHHFVANHMPINVSAQRAIIERRAEEIGRSVEDANESLADYVTANRMVVQKGFERMQRGEIDVEMPDLLKAIQSLHQIESSMGGSVDTEVWVTATAAFSEIVRQLVTPEQWLAIGTAMSRHPVIASLAEKMNEPVGALD